MHAGSLVITDPQAVPTYSDGPISRWCRQNLAESRDEVFVRLALKAVATQIAAMAGVSDRTVRRIVDRVRELCEDRS